MSSIVDARVLRDYTAQPAVTAVQKKQRRCALAGVPGIDRTGLVLAESAAGKLALLEVRQASDIRRSRSTGNSGTLIRAIARNPPRVSTAHTVKPVSGR
jgi:hypothetical protein